MASAPRMVAISSAASAGIFPVSCRASLYWMAAMFMVRTMSRWFELLGESHPRATATPRASSSGMRPCSGTPRPPLAAVTGHMATLARVRATQSSSASSSPRQCARSTLGPRTPIDSRYAVGVWPWRATISCRALLPLLWCSVRPVWCSSATRFRASSRPALHVSWENGIAHARIRPSRRPFHLAMNEVVRATASGAG